MSDNPVQLFAGHPYVPEHVWAIAQDRIRLLQAVAKAALEVWLSVPASHSEADPMVWRHGLALNALSESLHTAGYEVEP